MVPPCGVVAAGRASRVHVHSLRTVPPSASVLVPWVPGLRSTRCARFLLSRRCGGCGCRGFRSTRCAWLLLPGSVLVVCGRGFRSTRCASLLLPRRCWCRGLPGLRSTRCARVPPSRSVLVVSGRAFRSTRCAWFLLLGSVLVVGHRPGLGPLATHGSSFRPRCWWGQIGCLGPLATHGSSLRVGCCGRGFPGSGPLAAHGSSLIPVGPRTGRHSDLYSNHVMDCRHRRKVMI